MNEVAYQALNIMTMAALFGAFGTAFGWAWGYEACHQDQVEKELLAYEREQAHRRAARRRVLAFQNRKSA